MRNPESDCSLTCVSIQVLQDLLGWKLASPYYIGLAKDRNPESGISSRWSNPKPKHVEVIPESGIRNFAWSNPKLAHSLGLLMSSPQRRCGPCETRRSLSLAIAIACCGNISSEPWLSRLSRLSTTVDKCRRLSKDCRQLSSLTA